VIVWLDIPKTIAKELRAGIVLRRSVFRDNLSKSRTQPMILQIADGNASFTIRENVKQLLDSTPLAPQGK
jgi:hypothetical protein